jgi:hypothetical protein
VWQLLSEIELNSQHWLPLLLTTMRIIHAHQAKFIRKNKAHAQAYNYFLIEVSQPLIM